MIQAAVAPPVERLPAAPEAGEVQGAGDFASAVGLSVEYEGGALFRNPMPHIVKHPDLEGVTARRVDQLADELGFDKARIVGWGIAQAVLSAWWSYEDHGYGWESAITLAEIMAGVGG